MIHRSLSPERIAKAFSGGNFDQACLYLAEEAVWEVFGAQPLVGRAAVEATCRAAAVEYTSIGTNLCVDQVDEAGQMILVTGTVEFFRDGRCVRSVAACDVFTFCPAGKLLAICSYCGEP